MMQSLRTSKHHKLSRSTRCCQLEKLESRDLLAGDLPLSIEGGVVSGETEVGSLSGSISGQVLLTDAQTCAQDSGKPIEDVTLRLLDEQGQLLSQVESDAQGAYRFDGLGPGLYAVQQIQPGDLQTGKAHFGTGGGIVFESNLIGEIALESGTDLYSYDFCEFPLATNPEQIDPADRAIEAHGKGDEVAPAEQLVGVAQRFDQLVNIKGPTTEKTITEQAPQESDVVLELDAAGLTTENSAKAKQSSSQEVKSRPQAEHESIPEEFWDVLESIGTDTLLSVAEELPWMSAQDATSTDSTESQRAVPEHGTSSAEDSEVVPVDASVDPTHVATNVNNAEGAEPSSTELWQ